MLQDKHEKDKFFAHIFSLALELDPVLAQLDCLLEDETLYQLIRHDLAQRHPLTEVTGRNSTPVEVILRMLTVRHLYQWSYEKTEHHVRDSLGLRMFCRVYFENVPDDTTLLRWANLIQPTTLAHYNQRVLHLATQLQVTRGRKLRTDGTVVETNIHAPTDNSLLADGVRVLGRTLRRAKALLAEKTTLAKTVFRNRTPSAKRLARQIGYWMGRNQEKGRQAYQTLVQITEKTVTQVKKVLPELKEAGSQQAAQLVATLETFLSRVEQVIRQTVRRVFQGEKVPAKEKLMSLFEPHTAIIKRNRPTKPTEFGRKVWLDEVEGGLISNWRILAGNPQETTQWLPSLDAHEALFGHPPVQASADRGVFSFPNEKKAKARGIKRVVLPKKGGKTAERQAYEKQRWFRRGRRWHAGVEGRISVLKRVFGLTRCLNRGEKGFGRWIGWNLIAHNLRSIGVHQVAKAVKSS